MRRIVAGYERNTRLPTAEGTEEDMTEQTVLIAGAGPVGILNALGLARAGISVTVLERGSEVVQSPRAMVYHWSVLDGLERLGLFDAAAARGSSNRGTPTVSMPPASRCPSDSTHSRAGLRTPTTCISGRTLSSNLHSRSFRRFRTRRCCGTPRFTQLIKMTTLCG